MTTTPTTRPKAGCPARRWPRTLVDAEAGSVSVELVLFTPLILLMIGFVILAGRLVDLRLQVESAAHQAARAASHQPSPEAARNAATRITGQLEPRCAGPSTDVDTSEWRPGGTVRVTVSCHARLADLTMLPLPAQVSVSASFASPLDKFAVRQP